MEDLLFYFISNEKFIENKTDPKYTRNVIREQNNQAQITKIQQVRI